VTAPPALIAQENQTEHQRLISAAYVVETIAPASIALV
jgi:hypothetical protein